jgi:hypothetical protein
VSQVGKKFNKSIVIKSVVASFSDSTNRLEAAFARRLDLGGPILHMIKRGAPQCAMACDLLELPTAPSMIPVARPRDHAVAVLRLRCCRKTSYDSP